jgi:mono/diheme cytochrome c family protein
MNKITHPKKPVRATLALAAAGFAATFALSSLPTNGGQARASEDRIPTPASSPATLERGKYLVTIAGCNDCHTPFKMGDNGPEPDMSRMLSGHPSSLKMPPPARLPEGPWQVQMAATNTAFAGPWGVSYTANLTPHETGLGLWTFANFRDALRTGKHMGRGRDILPPMPWPMYRHLTDEDIEAVYSYLRTIPAIDNQVPDPEPPTG